MDFIINPIFQSVTLAVVSAQLIKTLVDYRRQGRLQWQSFFRGAGMPSSHTATVISLSLAVFLTEGMSTVFIATLVFSAIVIRDVIGDKVFAVHQENLINKIFQQIMMHEKVEWTHLTGHTITEVLAGMVVGLATTLAVFYIK